MLWQLALAQHSFLFLKSNLFRIGPEQRIDVTHYVNYVNRLKWCGIHWCITDNPQLWWLPLPGMLKMCLYLKKTQNKFGNSLNWDLIKWCSAGFVKLKWRNVTTAAQGSNKTSKGTTSSKWQDISASLSLIKVLVVSVHVYGAFRDSTECRSSVFWRWLETKGLHIKYRPLQLGTAHA